MNISVSSKGYDVIETGVVIAYEEDSDVTFHFVGDSSFKFNLRMVFEKDDSKELIINRTVQGEEIEFKCVNFADSGTGTSVPIEVATFKGKKIYIRFWSYLQGESQGQKKTRKIEYTFFAER